MIIHMTSTFLVSSQLDVHMNRTALSSGDFVERERSPWMGVEQNHSGQPVDVFTSQNLREVGMVRREPMPREVREIELSSGILFLLDTGREDGHAGLPGYNRADGGQGAIEGDDFPSGNQAAS